MSSTSASRTRVRIDRITTPRSLREQLEQDVLRGLTGPEKWLPPTYFYDARGSALFEEITGLDEYYPTRAETEILEAVADDWVAAVGPDEVVELGSGSSHKTRLLLEAMDRAGSGDRYVPIDVSETALAEAGERLGEAYAWLDVHGLVADFHEDLGRIPRSGDRLVAFLGSTIGNLDRTARQGFLGDVRGLLRDRDRLLLGVDLVKDPDVLVAAYDDARGVTAAFNRNMLHVVNRELSADLPVDDFDHVARWNADEERIEMRLRASRAMTAHLPTLDLDVTFREGEELLTELSCKFRREGLARELAAAGLTIERWHTDRQERFGCALIAPSG